MCSLRVPASILAAVLLLPCLSLPAQTANLKQQIESKYALTKPTADRTDIVTAGDVIVLQKDKLLMWATTNAYPPQNTYKGGKIQQSAMSRFAAIQVPGQATNVVSRTYVTGEKFWITGLDIKDDGVLFTVMSDPVNDIRFYGALKFPFPKGSPPPPDQILGQIAEVFKVQPADNAPAGGNNQQAGAKSQPPPAAAAPASAPAPMAAIAPPPPPADAPPAAPPTIAIGQTRDQVTAMFGAPTKVIKLPTKEIDVYPDMKVTFVKDKVTNVQ